MATWPKAPRDYDSFLINTWHGNPGKNQKLNIYRDALTLACKELARLHKEEYGGDVDSRRTGFIRQAIETMRKEKS